MLINWGYHWRYDNAGKPHKIGLWFFGEPHNHRLYLSFKKAKRAIQFITNVHRIHHTKYSYGWTFRPIPIGYFDGHEEKKNHPDYWALKSVRGFHMVRSRDYHDCTSTGVY